MLFNRFKSFLRDYFTLTSRERRGALVLMLMLIAEAGILFYMRIQPAPADPLLEEFRLPIDSFVTRSMAPEPPQKTLHFNPFPFNPNTIGDEEWKALGFTDRQVAVIRNYLTKGGVFRKNEDLAKMFVVSDEHYRRLESYIAIPPPEPQSQTTTFSKRTPALIELNSADTNLLATLPMIGPGRARLIARYRERLGGFYDKAQLLEVFTIDTAVFNLIQDRVMANQQLIRPLEINTEEWKHPYLTSRETSVIKAWRQQHGDFQHPDDLKKVMVVKEETIVKLLPYLEKYFGN